LIAVRLFSFLRISAVLGPRFFFENGRLYWFRPIEKGGKYHKVPVYHMRIANR